MRVRRAEGFTLIEMVVVIAVLGLIMAVLARYGPWQSRWLQAKGLASTIASAMNADRGEAIATGAPVPLIVPHLPKGLTMAITAPPGGIVFEPDGSTSGGRVLLTAGDRSIAVTADWLTGRVRVDAP